MLNDKSCESNAMSTVLEGTYVIGTQWSQLSYTFEKNGKVTLQSSTTGFTLYNQTGTYQISEGGNEISFSFSAPMGMPMGMPMTNQSAQCVTYPFSKGEGYIRIGDLCYNLVGNSASGRTEHSSEEQNPQPPEPETPSAEALKLTGTYVMGTPWSQLSYTFEKNGKVTFQSSTTGFTLYNQTGTYQINESESQISFSFPVAMGMPMVYRPSQSGTFAFSRGTGFILIGGMRYELLR